MYVLAVIALGIASMLSIGAAFLYRRNLLAELFALVGIIVSGNVLAWAAMVMLARGHGTVEVVLGASLWGPLLSALMLLYRLNRLRKGGTARQV